MALYKVFKHPKIRKHTHTQEKKSKRKTANKNLIIINYLNVKKYCKGKTFFSFFS